MTDPRMQAAPDGPFDRVAHAREVRDVLPVGLPRAVISNLLAVITERDATIARMRALADDWEKNGMPAFEVPSLLAAAQLRRALDGGA